MLCIAIPLEGAWGCRIARRGIAMAAEQGPVVFGLGGAAEVAGEQFPVSASRAALYIGFDDAARPVLSSACRQGAGSPD